MTVDASLVRVIRFNALLAAIVWAGWYFIGGAQAVESISRNWVVALTMVFGSLVGGGTSEGGGAVAFPVFTKLLGIPPSEARVFSLAIQSIGMTCASLTILYMKTKIDWRVIRWCAPAGIAGIVFSTFAVMPYVAPPLVKICFTVMVSSLAIALFCMNAQGNIQRYQSLPVLRLPEKALLIAAGFVGGILSGLVGCGENIAAFAVTVLLFRLCEKVATPTTVILMTLVTLVGFALHVFIVGDFTPVVQGYWLAAVPIVCIGAPLGAVICSRMSRRAIVNFLIGLISLEFLTTAWIIPMSPAVLATAGTTLLLCGWLNWKMCRTDIYSSRTRQAGPQENLLALT